MIGQSDTRVRLTVLVVIALVTALQSKKALAEVTTYTNRAEWVSALDGSPDCVVDFNEVLGDTSFLDTVYDAGPFSLHGVSPGEDRIDAVPFLGTGNQAVDGTTYAHCSVDRPTSGDFVIVTFESCVSAWGADFSAIDNGHLDMIVMLQSGSTTIEVPDVADTTSTFFGIVASDDDQICQITFVGRTSTEDFGIDNVAVVCPCAADVNGNGVVDVNDLVLVVLCFGQDGADCPAAGVTTDVNGDGTVDVLDIVAIVLAWGPCSGQGPA